MQAFARLKLRPKLFLLLAAVALGALAVLATLDFRAAQAFANREVAVRRAGVARDLTQILIRSVDADAQVLNGLADTVAVALAAQAADVEHRLDGPAPSLPLYFPERFDGPRAGWPPGAVLTRYAGYPVRIPVSTEEAVVLVPHGIDAAAVRPDLERLAATVPAMRALYREHPGLIFGELTALENGARISYPGHGRWPASYDSRKRSFYTTAKAAGKRVWTPPLFAVTGRTLALFVAQPVHGADGRIAGVAAIDVDVLDVLQQLERGTLRQDGDAQASLVRLSESASAILVTAGRNALDVLARRSYNEHAAAWNLPPSLETIAAGNSPDEQSLVEDVRARRSGIARLEFDGHDSLLAYSPVPAFGASLLLILPYEGIEAAAEEASRPLRAAARDQLRESLLVALALLVAVGIIAYFVAAAATAPIRTLVAFAHRVGGGDLAARAPVNGSDEIAELAATFNAMVPRLRQGLRLAQGLEIARAVQQSLLPLHPPVLAGFDIAGASEYCDETGGDYYDFAEIENDRGSFLVVAIGDVSGHGIGAALVMASARASLRGAIGTVSGPREAVERTNRLLCSDISDGSFMTLMVLVIDTRTGAMRWVNAAHDVPLILQTATHCVVPIEGADVALGIDDDWAYDEHSIQLPTGDLLIALGTDGIWETENAAGEQFGRARWERLVRDHSDACAADFCRIVLAAVDAFRGTARAEDDVTLVIVKFRVPAPAPAPAAVRA